MVSSAIGPALLGLSSAACWGAGDFSGGLATRRSNVYGVVVVSQVVGVALLIGAALAFAEKIPSLDRLLWGGLAGACGAVGLVALYRALAQGRMGVAAPVSAVITAVVPVVAGVWLEGLPTAVQLSGFALALVSIWFIARTETSTIAFNDLGLPLLAGLGFGFFLVFINRASDTAVLWPLVVARFASLGMLAGIAMLSRQAWRPETNRLPLIVLAGVCDVAGNALFALGAQSGRLDVTAVLASLYPASTVALAWIVLKERITRLQAIGIVAALAAIMLITI